jgi:ribosome recycling factor
MLNDLFNDTKARMEKAKKSLQEELLCLRAGRASPDILHNIIVPYYGKDTPLNQMASIVVESALMLHIKPWDKKSIPQIQQAILKSDLGLNPTSSGEGLRLPLPPLTEERRKELIKKVRSEGENAKVSIRNVRRDANQTLKTLLKDKDITEDDEKRAEERIQKLTDTFVADIEKTLHDKEKELLDI